MSLSSLSDFLHPINLAEISNDEGYTDKQLGKYITIHTDDVALEALVDADLVLVGCGELRGMLPGQSNFQSADAIRTAFYSLFFWHKSIKIADAGNVKTGTTLNDSYAALRTVVDELLQHNKRVVIIGASHDVTLAQYQVYAQREKIIEATCVDAFIDLNMDSSMPADKFLMEMLTGLPNYIKHYNHIGFQSYFVHPDMLETIDKLRFDCHRVGHVKEKLEEMEPAIRNSHLFSFDISAIQHAHAPANKKSPNGFTGEEACVLMQYAGMSTNVNTIGIYGYVHQYDQNNLTAIQISHLLWYLIDGIYKAQTEAVLTDRDNFREFTLAFAEIETTFLQSKRTSRWWMQMPDASFAACSRYDYVLACNNEIPERWLRIVERS